MVKTTNAAGATPAAKEEKKAVPVVAKKKFTVAANGKKVPAAGTIAKAPVPAKKVTTVPPSKS